MKGLKGLTICFGLAALVLPVSAMAQISYTFETVNFPHDSFTQLLGINDFGDIAGYHGSGLPGHPNQGFTLNLPNTFTTENFPGAVQTQVIGINNLFNTAGFYIDAKGANHGFLKVGSTYFATIDFPATTSAPKVNQLLGLNTNAEQAGFYNDSANNSHGYIHATNSGGLYLEFTYSAATSLTATGVNEAGQISGFYTDKAGAMHGFLLNQGFYTVLNFPGATGTQAFGLNNQGQVVGSYTDSAGMTHGFIWTNGKFEGPVDDPRGIGATIINGINDGAVIVGFSGVCVTAPVGATICNGFVGTP